jgi:hypothetical protein
MYVLRPIHNVKPETLVRNSSGRGRAGGRWSPCNNTSVRGLDVWRCWSQSQVSRCRRVAGLSRDFGTWAQELSAIREATLQSRKSGVYPLLFDKATTNNVQGKSKTRAKQVQDKPVSENPRRGLARGWIFSYPWSERYRLSLDGWIDWKGSIQASSMKCFFRSAKLLICQHDDLCVFLGASCQQHGEAVLCRIQPLLLN